MNKIQVFRTHIEIHDYNLGDRPYLEKTFSIYDKLYHKSYFKGMIYDSASRVLMLPRGVEISKLERDFNCLAHVDLTVDPIRKVDQIGLRYTPRDEDQLEAIKFMLGINRYANNKRHTMLSLNLNTGKGKSYCAIATIAYKSVASAIITDTIGCLEQWEGYFQEYTDITRDQIFRISGSASIAKLYRMDVSNYKVFLIPHATLQSYGSNNGWQAVHELFRYLGIGIKIYDEAHLDFDNMMMIDCYTNTHTTYYLTATLARSSFEEDKIFKIYFNGVPKIDLFHEDTDPHTMYVGIKYNSQPGPMDISNCMSAYGLNRVKYTDYVIHQPRFHDMLHVLINKTISKPGKSLWYIGTNNAILYVRDWIYQNYPNLIRQVGIYTSIVPKEFRKKELEKKIILTTTKSAGAALDIKGLVETINLAEPFKSRVLAQQTFGRTRDDNTIYKDITDVGFDQLRSYYNHKKPVFSKYATECKEVVIKPKDLERMANEIRQKRAELQYPILFEHDHPEKQK